MQLLGLNIRGSLKAGRQSWKISKFAKNWPVQRALKKGNLVDRNWILVVLTLHARSYPSCKNQHLDQLTLVTLTCQSQVEYRWNTGAVGQFVLISGVPCYTYYFKCPVSIRLKLHVCIPMLFSYPAVQLHGLNICGSLKAGRQSWKIFQICQKLTHAASPEKG